MGRFLAVLLAGLVATGAVVSTSGAARRAATFQAAGLAGGSGTFRDTILSGSRRLQAATRAGRWGGATTANDGETVDIFVSDTYPVDPTVTQSFADFVVQLYHGTSCRRNLLHGSARGAAVRTPGGSRAVATTRSRRRSSFPARTCRTRTGRRRRRCWCTSTVTTSRETARTRRGPPRTGERSAGRPRSGSARGSSAEARFRATRGSNYLLNPGEAWAETYRLLNFDKQTWPSWTVLAPWNVDQSFYPDATALQAAEEDVLDPWTGPTVATWAGTGRDRQAKRAQGDRDAARRLDEHQVDAGAQGLADLDRRPDDQHRPRERPAPGLVQGLRETLARPRRPSEGDRHVQRPLRDALAPATRPARGLDRFARVA